MTDAPDDLLARFERMVQTYSALQHKETEHLNVALHDLLPGFQNARKTWAESQRLTADDFNLFEVLEVESNEVSHSKILAWLLDHRIENGTHAQGKLGFQLFLEELARELDLQPAKLRSYLDDAPYWVHLELSGGEARVELASRNRFLIHIENKIHAKEGVDQTNREWRDLQARRIELAVPEESCHAIFLTLDGHRAENESFRPVRWSRIATVLDRFAELAVPPDVRLFACHYAMAIRKLSVLARVENTPLE